MLDLLLDKDTYNKRINKIKEDKASLYSLLHEEEAQVAAVDIEQKKSIKPIFTNYR